eukprot:TRINITY_DN30113_c0_g2_i1.p1 TRINITY_DN30113_c0_g2~~TRINITY_DN30113_c0_g2_i1.p1  ORF type:complete len:525 (+),score=85.80 TRINITY_DN30113_c0_g2_i1:435-2009(+)
MTMGFPYGQSVRDFGAPTGCHVRQGEMRWNTFHGTATPEVQLVCPGPSNLCTTMNDRKVSIKDVCPEDLYMADLADTRVEPNDAVLIRNQDADKLLLKRVKEEMMKTKPARLAALKKQRLKQKLRGEKPDDSAEDVWEKGYEQLQRLAEAQVADVLAFKETWADHDTHMLAGLDPADGAFARGKLTTASVQERLPSLLDFRAWVHRQSSMAVVGSGQVLRNTTFGLDIDAHEEVVRFNDLIPERIKMNATEIGRKTTVHVECAKVAPMKSPSNLEFDLEWNTPWLSWCRRMHWGGEFSGDAAKALYLVRPAALCSLAEPVAQFTRGFLFYWFIGRLFKDVDLYGFAGTKHYQSDDEVFEDFLSFEHMVYRTAKELEAEVEELAIQAARDAEIHARLSVAAWILAVLACASLIGFSVFAWVTGRCTHVVRFGKKTLVDSVVLGTRIIKLVQKASAANEQADLMSPRTPLSRAESLEGLLGTEGLSRTSSQSCEAHPRLTADVLEAELSPTNGQRRLLRSDSGISC